jgi:hypothetical protein
MRQCGWEQDTLRQTQEIGSSSTVQITATDTPQQNGLVERKFVSLYGCVCAMAEVANMANEAENMALKVGKNAPFCKEFFGVDSKNVWNLRCFGESVIAKEGPDIQSKMANPGIAVMYLGHLTDHGKEVYYVQRHALVGSELH